MKLAPPVVVAWLACMSVGSPAGRGDEPPNSMPTPTPAALFDQLQVHFDAGRYAEVVRLGRRIEEIDRYGDRYRETASVYAILAGSHALLGREAERAGDLRRALDGFKRAASCNRSFADAMAFWYKDPLYQHPGMKPHIDSIQKLYE